VSEVGNGVVFEDVIIPASRLKRASAIEAMLSKWIITARALDTIELVENMVAGVVFVGLDEEIVDERYVGSCRRMESLWVKETRPW
jgi:hypothetical protein